MKKWVIFILLLFPATTAFANPVIVHNPAELVGLVIIYVSCFGLEVLLVTTILFFCHMAVVPLLIALFTGNVVMYFVIFQPILSATGNVPASEAVIVAVEGAFIKMISLFDTFQLEDFKGLKWRSAFIIAAVGNLLSYYSGTVIGG
jgi:hypothetical protein